MVFAHFLRTVYQRVFMFHVLICLGENRIPDVFKFTRSKVKVTWVIFCDQLCKQFLLDILKLLIIKPKGTYPIPIYKVTSCQAPHFYNITGSMYLFITLLSKPLFDRRSQGAYVSYLVIIILLKIYILGTYYQSYQPNRVCNFSSDLICHNFSVDLLKCLFNTYHIP